MVDAPPLSALANPALLDLSQMAMSPMWLWAPPILLGLLGFVLALIGGRVSAVARVCTAGGLAWLFVGMLLTHPAVVLCIPWILLLGFVDLPKRASA